jgi:hypothetical protein
METVFPLAVLSEFNMHRIPDQDRPPGPVVPRIVDVLNVKCSEHSPLERPRKVVVGLHYLLRSIPEGPVAKNEP